MYKDFPDCVAIACSEVRKLYMPFLQPASWKFLQCGHTTLDDLLDENDIADVLRETFVYADPVVIDAMIEVSEPQMYRSFVEKRLATPDPNYTTFDRILFDTYNYQTLLCLTNWQLSSQESPETSDIRSMIKRLGAYDTHTFSLNELRAETQKYLSLENLVYDVTHKDERSVDDFWEFYTQYEARLFPGYTMTIQNEALEFELCLDSTVAPMTRVALATLSAELCQDKNRFEEKLQEILQKNAVQEETSSMEMH